MVMSRTLFWYVFRDLVRIFLLTVGVLAGIMSFGGLLRPLTQHGLDAGQVAAVLYYFMPAMSTYSLPIAALFATTMVYGRLSADNEITAMRAGGISHLSIAMPAMLLGLVVALISLFFLSFWVPVFTLKVERVVYSNLARMVASRIERTHEINMGGISIFALDADVLPADPSMPNVQQVRLHGPAFKTYIKREDDQPGVRTPEDFWLARAATVLIDRAEDEVSINVKLEDGVKFARQLRGAVQAGIEATWVGPIPVPSPIKENTKFMNIDRLRELLEHPESSTRVQTQLRSMMRREQDAALVRKIAEHLRSNGGSYVFRGGEVYVLTAGGATVESRRGEVVLRGATGTRPIRLTQQRGGPAVLRAEANYVRLRVRADNANENFLISVEMSDVITTDGGEQTSRSSFRREFLVPIDPEYKTIRERPVDDFLQSRVVPAEDRRKLARDLIVVGNDVRSEINGRASFAVSCLILVLVGCALGMMFKSGNFLSAFAVSVVPAMLSILLIVTGQHTAENVPSNPTPENNPLALGLTLIWGGNLGVAAIASVLLWRLQRQ
jgi:lipopolysaccharide export LptBFGC system permease protein LptF